MNEKPYRYRHPHPAVSVDCAVFSVFDDDLQLLLVQRGVEPYKDSWALPGGFVRIDEDLGDAALRELTEETGIEGFYLEQLGAFGAPDRDPRERVITVAYFAVISHENLEIQAGSDASEAMWHSSNSLPDLAFDHEAIIRCALASVRARLRTSPLALQFLPAEFTLTQLQRVHEIILGEAIDKRNFRKWASSFDYIEDTGHRQLGTPHRPASLYRARKVISTEQEPAGAPLASQPSQASTREADSYQDGYRAGFDAAIKSVTQSIQGLNGNS